MSSLPNRDRVARSPSLQAEISRPPLLEMATQATQIKSENTSDPASPSHQPPLPSLPAEQQQAPSVGVLPPVRPEPTRTTTDEYAPDLSAAGRVLGEDEHALIPKLGKVRCCKYGSLSSVSRRVGRHRTARSTSLVDHELMSTTADSIHLLGRSSIMTIRLVSTRLSQALSGWTVGDEADSGCDYALPCRAGRCSRPTSSSSTSTQSCNTTWDHSITRCLALPSSATFTVSPTGPPVPSSARAQPRRGQPFAGSPSSPVDPSSPELITDNPFRL